MEGNLQRQVRGRLSSPNGKKSAAYGIYELKGNKLKICYRGTVRTIDSKPRISLAVDPQRVGHQGGVDAKVSVVFSVFRRGDAPTSSTLAAVFFDASSLVLVILIVRLLRWRGHLLFHLLREFRIATE
jgi:hypothetical protein